ncbi:hypothetical protein NUACC21_35220 [Scytonema sp. NUACC21]
MNNLHSLRIFAYTSKPVMSSGEDETDTRLSTLLDWCKIVQTCLEAGQVEDAKFFLSQAIIEAEKPIKG